MAAIRWFQIRSFRGSVPVMSKDLEAISVFLGFLEVPPEPGDSAACNGGHWHSVSLVQFVGFPRQGQMFDICTSPRGCAEGGKGFCSSQTTQTLSDFPLTSCFFQYFRFY